MVFGVQVKDVEGVRGDKQGFVLDINSSCISFMIAHRDFLSYSARNRVATMDIDRAAESVCILVIPDFVLASGCARVGRILTSRVNMLYQTLASKAVSGCRF